MKLDAGFREKELKDLLDLIDVPPQAHMLDKNILNFQRKRKSIYLWQKFFKLTKLGL